MLCKTVLSICSQKTENENCILLVTLMLTNVELPARLNHLAAHSCNCIFFLNTASRLTINFTCIEIQGKMFSLVMFSHALRKSNIFFSIYSFAKRMAFSTVVVFLAQDASIFYMHTKQFFTILLQETNIIKLHKCGCLYFSAVNNLFDDDDDDML